MHIVIHQGQYTDVKLFMDDPQSSGNTNYKHKLHDQALKVSILV